MSGRWKATNRPNERTKVGYVKIGRNEFEEHDCQPSGSGGSWTCHCGRAWSWSGGSGVLTWGESRKGRGR